MFRSNYPTLPRLYNELKNHFTCSIKHSAPWVSGCVILVTVFIIIFTMSGSFSCTDQTEQEERKAVHQFILALVEGNAQAPVVARKQMILQAWKQKGKDVRDLFESDEAYNRFFDNFDERNRLIFDYAHQGFINFKFKSPEEVVQYVKTKKLGKTWDLITIPEPVSANFYEISYEYKDYKASNIILVLNTLQGYQCMLIK